MSKEHRRPLFAFVAVLLACSVILAHGARGEALPGPLRVPIPAVVPGAHLVSTVGHRLADVLPEENALDTRVAADLAPFAMARPAQVRQASMRTPPEPQSSAPAAAGPAVAQPDHPTAAAAPAVAQPEPAPAAPVIVTVPAPARSRGHHTVTHTVTHAARGLGHAIRDSGRGRGDRGHGDPRHRGTGVRHAVGLVHGIGKGLGTGLYLGQRGGRHDRGNGQALARR